MTLPCIRTQGVIHADPNLTPTPKEPLGEKPKHLVFLLQQMYESAAELRGLRRRMAFARRVASDGCRRFLQLRYDWKSLHRQAHECHTDIEARLDNEQKAFLALPPESEAHGRSPSSGSTDAVSTTSASSSQPEFVPPMSPMSALEAEEEEEKDDAELDRLSSSVSLASVASAAKSVTPPLQESDGASTEHEGASVDDAEAASECGGDKDNATAAAVAAAAAAMEEDSEVAAPLTPAPPPELTDQQRRLALCRSKLRHIGQLSVRPRLRLALKEATFVDTLLAKARSWGKGDLLKPMEVQFQHAPGRVSELSGPALLRLFFERVMSGEAGLFSRPCARGGGLAMPEVAAPDEEDRFVSVGALLLKALFEGARLPPMLHPLVARMLLLEEPSYELMSKKVPEVSLDDLRIYDPGKTLDMQEAARLDNGDPYNPEKGYERRLHGLCWDLMVGSRLASLVAIRKGFTQKLNIRPMVLRGVDGAELKMLLEG
mmetsp:Transcript_31023/g.98530  ORF Transcript_31023/g.98530 Transcript_31023/m.98530 type:complete len:488 (-) Transcript_31023:125-1588(-)